MAKIRTRFAPSPTGFLHIGGLRTALYAYALAKHENGDFLLRIEDTDQKRQVPGATEALKGVLTKFNLLWDEEYVQSERQKEGIYKRAADKLVKEGHAFYCDCKAKNAKEEGYSKVLRDPCRDKGLTQGAVKLMVPEDKTVSYFDIVHKKEISWNTNEVYDATLLKSDGFPTYHLAVAVDDLDMKVTHLLRGHDWLPSTPIHLLVFEYLGGNMPAIGHLTDILSSQTGKKLSKRRDSVFVETFLNEGYLPEALLNFVMLLGWAPKDNQEVYNLNEFVKDFDPGGFQEANPRFFQEKLDWFNGFYIRKLSLDDLTSKLEQFEPRLKDLGASKKKEIVSLSQERIKSLKDFSGLCGFFFTKPEHDKAAFNENDLKHIKIAHDALMGLDDWNIEKINPLLMQEINNNKIKVGDFFMSLRIAITGNKFTPPINESMVILGKEEVLKRLETVLGF